MLIVAPSGMRSVAWITDTAHGDAELAAHDRGVTADCADVRRRRRRPTRNSGTHDGSVVGATRMSVGPHLRRVGRVEHDPGAAGDDAGRAGSTLQHLADDGRRRRVRVAAAVHVSIGGAGRSPPTMYGGSSWWSERNAASRSRDGASGTTPGRRGTHRARRRGDRRSPADVRVAVAPTIRPPSSYSASFASWISRMHEFFPISRSAIQRAADARPATRFPARPRRAASNSVSSAVNRSRSAAAR